jgi:hypothetical protein
MRIPWEIKRHSRNSYRHNEGMEKIACHKNPFTMILNTHLEEWIGKGYEIILSGGLNEQLGADAHGFAWICTD